MPDTTPLDWNEDDAIALRNYIANNPKFLDHLKSKAPAIKGATMEESAMTGHRHGGFEDAINTIKAMQLSEVAGSDKAEFIQ